MNTLPLRAPPRIPRGPLIAIGVLLLVVLIAVATVRLSGTVVREPDAAALQTRLLRFEDRADGSIAVIDAQLGREIHRIVGEAGFVRGTLRGMARERKRLGGGPEQAFALTARADGRLTLHDPVTGRTIDLDAFGPVNAAGFARLLTIGQAPLAANTANDTPATSPVALRTEGLATTRTP